MRGIELSGLLGDEYEIPRSPKFVKSDFLPCDSCTIKGTPVLPKFSTVKNPLMIIGAYPGAKEVEKGKVFVGKSGEYLYEVLIKVGFTPDEIENEIYETNVLKCRPLGQKKYPRPPTDEEIRTCGWLADKEVKEFKPKLIILCGEQAVKYFLNRKFISSIRGQVKIKGNQKFLITFNPAHIIREPADSVDRKRFEDDIRSAYEIYKDISHTKKREYKLINSYEELDSVLTFLSKKIVSVDFETYAPGKLKEKKALDPYAEGFKILSAALSGEEHKAYCILLEHPDNKLDLQIVVSKLKAFLENEDIPKIGQNFKFDYKIAAVHFGIYTENIIFDTMLASSLLDSRKGVHNLDRLAMDWLNERTYKFEMYRLGSYIPEVEKLVERNCTDADYVTRLYPILKKRLIEQQLYTYLMEQRIPAISALARAEIFGLPIDVKYTKNLAKQYEDELETLEEKVFSDPMVQIIPDFNIDSNQDLQTLLFEKYKLPIVKEIKTGYSTDKEVFQTLLDRFPNYKILQDIQDYKDVEKFFGTYLDPMVKVHIKYDGRVHPTFTMHVAVTGRLSCVDPNVQNVPARGDRAKAIMDCYSAPEGYKIALADYSQIELRILAQASQDRIMLDALKKDEDLHQRTADEMGRKIGRVLSRHIGKGLNFGIVYGETKYGLAESLKLFKDDGSGEYDYDLAQVYLDEYLNVYEGIKEYQKYQKAFLKKYGYVLTLFGRKRWIRLTGNEKADEGAYRRAGNTPIQGTATDINTLAFVTLINLYTKEGFKSFPISLIHDAIMFQIHEDEEEDLKELNIHVMEHLPLPFLTDAKMKVDYTVGKTWGEAKGK